MHKLTLMLAAGAVGALAVSATTRSEAGALAGAEGLLPAIDNVSNIEKVHWRRGYRARYGAWGRGWGWRRYGWRRPYYRAAAWGYPGWGWRRPYYRAAAWGYPGWGHGYGWRRPIYGAAWGPGIGFGRPWGWGGWGWGGPRITVGFGWGW